MPYRLGILSTHPIQYYAPWFRHLANHFDVQVYYAHRQDAQGQSSAGFAVPFEWDVPILEGYSYHWLRNVAANPNVQTFNGCDTPEIRDRIREGRFDAFLVLGWGHKSSWQAMRTCKQTGVPILMRGDSQLRTLRSGMKRMLKYVPYRVLLPLIDAHLYVGVRNMEYLRHYGVPRSQLFFAPHFVDNGFFATGTSHARVTGQSDVLRDALGIPRGAFVVLFVGKLIETKRPADLIEAAKMLSRLPQGASFHTLLVGDGSMRCELANLAAPIGERVHFAGFRNQSEIAAYYAASDLLVVPSAGETWGLVVNEAMACGLPCIVSEAVGCAPDLIDDGVTGFKYPLGNIQLLFERIIEMQKLSLLYRQMIQEALAVKMERYSMEEATRGLRGALGSLGMP